MKTSIKALIGFVVAFILTSVLISATDSMNDRQEKTEVISFGGDVSTTDYWKFKDGTEINKEQLGKLVDYKIAYYSKKGFVIKNINVVNGGVTDVMHVVMERTVK